jgi:hypothetical protein
VPHRETVLVLPTVNCLVELTQMPFTVVALSDIEIINLERVGFNLKNFDMAIVFKVGRWANVCAKRAVAGVVGMWGRCAFATGSRGGGGVGSLLNFDMANVFKVGKG